MHREQAVNGRLGSHRFSPPSPEAWDDRIKSRSVSWPSGFFYLFFSLCEALLDDRLLHESTLANWSASFSRLAFYLGFTRETGALLR
jgi:hypothetical protein